MTRTRHDQTPEETVEIIVEEYLLRRAALERARSERQTVEAVMEAVSRGIPWDRIGQLLGIAPGSAKERYGEMRRAS